MGMRQFVGRELIEIIEWTDDSRDTLAHRFPDNDKAIKNGAQLIVRESQHAQLVHAGELGDAFGRGRHRLITENIPVLTRLASWRYGLESPFKVDVYFVTTRLFTGNKWGTTHPVMMRDNDFGVVRARAFGTYDFRVTNPRLFLKDVVGTDRDFTLRDFDDTMRSRVVSAFSDALASASIPVLDAATRYAELGAALLPAINPFITEKYGVALTAFVVENVSVPAEVEAAIDARTGMAAAGNLNDYVKYRMAEGLAKGNGTAAAATELGIGLTVAQEILKQAK